MFDYSRSDHTQHVMTLLSVQHTDQLLISSSKCLCFYPCPSIQHPLSPLAHSLSPLSSIVPHRLSFLSKPFSHPLLRLVFFPWASEWREGNGSFEFLMHHMKNVALVISQQYELVNFLQDTTFQVTRWCETMRAIGVFIPIALRGRMKDVFFFALSTEI